MLIKFKEILLTHIWPIVLALLISSFFKLFIEDWIKRQISHLDMPPLWIDYFYDESSQELSLLIKNVSTDKQSFKNPMLHLKYTEKVQIDSVKVYINDLATKIDSIKTRNNRVHYLTVAHTLNPKDFFRIKAKLQGPIDRIEILHQPEIVVNGERMLWVYSDQYRTIKNYLLYFKLSAWFLVILIVGFGFLYSIMSHYRTQAKYLEKIAGLEKDREYLAEIAEYQKMQK